MEIVGKMKSFIQGSKLIYVGTSDQAGEVHLSLTGGMRVLDERHVAFEEWFYKQTMEFFQGLKGAEITRIF